MRSAWLLMLLVACASKDDASTDDTDTDTDATDSDTDTDLSGDSGNPWGDTGDDANGGNDTGPTFGHPDIGATPLDGTWTGTFTYREAWGNNSNQDPLCEGTFEITIDGTSALHVSGSMGCDEFDPNFDPALFDALPLPPALIPDTSYGAMTGLFVAELTPGSFGSAQANINLAATNMNPYDKVVRVNFDAEAGTMSADKNDIVRFPFRTGQRLTIEGTRQ